MEPSEPLREDVIFADVSSQSDKNSATIAKKICDMDHSAVANKIVTPTDDSNSLEKKIGIKVSFSTLH